MKRTFAAVVVLLAGTAHGQVPHPVFSGRWVMVSPSAGYEQLVTQDATTVSIGPVAGQAGETAVYRLDGNESQNVMKAGGENATSVSKVSWKGSQLIISSTTTWSNGIKMEQVLLWSLDDRGQLLIEVRNQGQAAVTMVYQRQ